MQDDEVEEDIEENYSEDFERDDLASSIMDSKSKPARNAEGGSRISANATRPDSKNPNRAPSAT